MRIVSLCLIVCSLLLAPLAQAERTPAPADVSVYFIGLKDGDSVGQNLVVRFGLKGMGVAPAGIKLDKTGHHHLLIDADLPADLSQPLPSDEHHRHFGGGQTEVEISLSPGTHTLQLVLGDFLHIPFDPPIVSEQITVTVK